MREALVICPKQNNAGAPLDWLANNVASFLSEKFGGCTRREAFGHWVSSRGKLYAEPVWEFVTACDANEKSEAALSEAAAMIGREGEQEAVYIRFPCGRVEIRDTSHHVVRLAA